MDRIEFLKQIEKLKNVKRKGWVIDGIDNPESVADHSFSVGLMALVLGERRKDIDHRKAMKMALVHDIHESICGDIVPISIWEHDMKKHPKELFDDMTDEEKAEAEKKGFEKLSSFLGEQGKGYFELWKEMEAGKTPEAIFVKSLDRLDLAMQALRYSEKYPEKDLGHYIEFSKRNIKDPEITKIMEEVERQFDKNNKNKRNQK